MPDPEISLIPMPAKLEADGNAPYQLPADLTISSDAPGALIAGEQLLESSGLPWRLVDGREDTTLRLTANENAGTGKEGYRLDVTANGITIEAATSSGLFYGIQSLRQLLTPGCKEIPALHIEDAPCFEWRGMHLDVSRHFFDGTFVRRYIDLLAQHKLNIFHWHLTDDDGWRLALDGFPELTERTAWRGRHDALPPSYGSGEGRYGGFYSKEEIRDIIAYAAERQVTIVPEIDVPGHCKPVTVCHPHLLCEGDIARFKSVQDVAGNLLCAGREETFVFLERVISEVAELFPSPYIHMGGDERPEGPWEQCPLCAHRIATEGLAGPDALQGYFMERVRRMVAGCGKTMVGWNEITHGNRIDHSAIVMAWQDPEKGMSAAEAGFPVVMTPAQHTYFDLAQAEDPGEPGLRWAGVVTLRKAYDWNPVPVSSPSAAARVLGVEGCLWSETLIDEARAEYMAFPRLCALAEVAWTPGNRRSFCSFSSRLIPHLERLQRAGVRFRPPADDAPGS